MCRFAFYLGDPIRISSLVTDPANSIVHQSFQSREREEPLNGDGFGVAWYRPEVQPEPGLFCDISPAWNNPNLNSLARVTVSPCILAHVRAATPGLPVTRLNCHPFVMGRFAFMHNGRIGGFERLARPMQQAMSDDSWNALHGSTDSEHLFAWFRDRYLRRRSEDPDAEVCKRMAAALREAIADQEELKARLGVEEESKLNLVVTDGRCAVATRYVTSGGGASETLYVHSGSRYVCEDGICRMVDAEPGDPAVIVASEPLSEDPGWEPVPVNHLVTVRDRLGVDIESI
jgi:predicted glutamine amidotransferase